MASVGEYVADPTQGITQIQQLPRPVIRHRSRNYRHRRCPGCGHSAYRLRTACRCLHDLGELHTGRPRELHVVYSQHHCPGCGRYFNAGMDDLAAAGSHYTHRVVQMAIRLVVEDGLPYRTASLHLWRDQRVFVPFATIQNWVEAGGKKGGARHGAASGRTPPALQRLSGGGRTARRALHRAGAGGQPPLRPPGG